MLPIRAYRVGDAIVTAVRQSSYAARPVARELSLSCRALPPIAAALIALIAMEKPRRRRAP